MATSTRTRAQRTRNYTAEYARRVARALERGLTRSQGRGHPKPGESSVSKRKSPKPIEDGRLQQALRSLRQEKSLTAAAKAARVSPERLKHVAQSKGAIKKEGRRWIVDPALPRRMPLFSRGRAIEVVVSGEAASQIGAYMDAVGKFLATNNRELLKPFVGQSVTDTSGTILPFETNPNTLYRLAAAGEATFEQVYRIVV
jgi:hypothetical protein